MNHGGFAGAVEITLLCVACRRWRCIAVLGGSPLLIYFISAGAASAGLC
jgi:hypothetical protein